MRAASGFRCHDSEVIDAIVTFDYESARDRVRRMRFGYYVGLRR